MVATTLESFSAKFSGQREKRLAFPGLAGIPFDTHIVPCWTKRALRLAYSKKLMRYANVSTTLNVYGNATLRAKQEANSKVVQMVMKHDEPLAVAV